MSSGTSSRTGLNPEETDSRFVAQHMSAYAFARPFVVGKRVLETGFGNGYGSNYLAEVAAHVTGIDITADNIPYATRTYPRGNLHFQQMEATQMTFPSGVFDVVCSFQVIEHIPEASLPRYLSEISRVLTPEGIFCVSTLNIAHNVKAGTSYQKHCHHEKEFTGEELRALLAQTFPSVAMHGLYLTWPHHVAQRLKKWGLMNWGPAAVNPIARYYEEMSVDAFQVAPRVSAAALDLIAICRTSGAAS